MSSSRMEMSKPVTVEKNSSWTINRSFGRNETCDFTMPVHCTALTRINIIYGNFMMPVPANR